MEECRKKMSYTTVQGSRGVAQREGTARVCWRCFLEWMAFTHLRQTIEQSICNRDWATVWLWKEGVRVLLCLADLLVYMSPCPWLELTSPHSTFYPMFTSRLGLAAQSLVHLNSVGTVVLTFETFTEVILDITFCFPVMAGSFLDATWNLEHFFRILSDNNAREKKKRTEREKKSDP